MRALHNLAFSEYLSSWTSALHFFLLPKWLSSTPNDWCLDQQIKPMTMLSSALVVLVMKKEFVLTTAGLIRSPSRMTTPCWGLITHCIFWQVSSNFPLIIYYNWLHILQISSNFPLKIYYNWLHILQISSNFPLKIYYNWLYILAGQQ